jgi:hypothetical protein
VYAAPSITTSSLPETTVNRPLVAASLSATGGRGTLSWSATGLPAGIGLTPEGEWRRLADRESRNGDGFGQRSGPARVVGERGGAVRRSVPRRRQLRIFQ